MSDTTAGNDSGAETDRRMLERTVPHAADSIRKVGFWTAIVLPFLYVPLLLYGLDSWVESTVFLTLLSVNLVALYVGHYHGR